MTDLPCDLQAESEVLSALLQFPDETVDEIRQILPEDGFFDLRHRLIYRAVLLQADAGEPIDAIAVRSRLEAMPRANGRGVEDLLEEAGGRALVFELSILASGSGGTAYHAGRLADLRLKRRAFTLGEDIRRRALSAGETGEALLSEVRQDLDALIAGVARQDLVTMDALLGSVLDSLRARDPHTQIGLSSGYPLLDRLLGGLRDGKLTIIAARPSMGKTAFATALILNMARSGVPVGVFSLETDEDGLGVRILGSLAGVNTLCIQGKSLSTSKLDDVYRIGDGARALPVVFDFRPDLDISQLRVSARRMASAHGIRALFVDYLQFLRPGKSERRESAFADISRGLKAVARELRLPVVVLSQLNRSVEQRGGDKVPLLSDLRESGAIEQDADQVLFLHRPGYYDQAKPAGSLSAIIAKNRDGPKGTVSFHLELTTGRVSEVALEHETPDEDKHGGRRDEQDPHSF